ncbi:MAG: glycosyltransferase [Bdellovibrionales bacterium]|nr:glycosyltransferase [Bdellovibrionales bacterium]
MRDLIESGPKISIIIPTFNRGKWIVRAIESVLDQSYRNWDLWVIDDGSTDQTSEIVMSYASKDDRVRLWTQENLGVSAARNKGIQQSQGEWLAFLDSDDRWLPYKLQRQMLEIEMSPDLKWVHGEEIWFRHNQIFNPKKIHKKSGGRQFTRSVDLCCISPSTVLIHRSVFSLVGYFREDFPVCEDYDLWLKIAARFEIGFVEEPLIHKFGGHADQLSQRFKAMDYWRVKSLFDVLFLKELDEEERRYVADSIIKRCEILLKGYRKHQNLLHFDEVQRILLNTQSFLNDLPQI